MHNANRDHKATLARMEQKFFEEKVSGLFLLLLLLFFFVVVVVLPLSSDSFMFFARYNCVNPPVYVWSGSSVEHVSHGKAL